MYMLHAFILLGLYGYRMAQAIDGELHTYHMSCPTTTAIIPLTLTTIILTMMPDAIEHFGPNAVAPPGQHLIQ